MLDRHCGSTPAHCEVEQGCQSGCNGTSAESTGWRVGANGTVSTTTVVVASTVMVTEAVSSTAAAGQVGGLRCAGKAAVVVSLLQLAFL